jgi:hypothetical protein
MMVELDLTSEVNEKIANTELSSRDEIVEWAEEVFGYLGQSRLNRGIPSVHFIEQPTHFFQVRVEGCDEEQAEKVLADRLDPGGKGLTGFGYQIHWEGF